MLNHFVKIDTKKNSIGKLMSTSALAIIIFQIAAGTTIVSAAGYPQQSGKSSAIHSFSRSDRAALHQAAAESSVPPMIQALERDPFFTKPFEFSQSDSAIDQDPFFLRSQKWTRSNPREETVSTQEEITFRVNESGFEVLVPGANISWKVSAPIHPVFQTDEYLFLAANAGSDLFLKKFASENTSGGVDSQGLFIVPIDSIYEASAVKAGVPVYFFPLPGDRWQSGQTGQTGSSQEVGAVEDPANDLIILKDTAGRNLPVLRAHVAGIIRAENVNLSLASMDALRGMTEKLKKNSSEFAAFREKFLTSVQQLVTAGKKNKQALNSQNFQVLFDHYFAFMQSVAKAAGSEELMPPRGSTAGFGSLYVGYDLDKPNSGSTMSVEPSQGVSQNTGSNVGQLLDTLTELLIPSAHADLDPVAMAKVMTFAMHAGRILATCAGIYLAGVAGYYTIGKKIFIEKGMKSTGIKATLDIYAHSLTTVAQIPSIWSSNVLEYFMDRVSISENGWIRKAFNATFGFARKTSSKTPVNARTLLFGVLLLGGVDTLLVGYQLYFMNAQVGDLLATLIPQLTERVNAAFHSDNPNVAVYNLVMLFANAIGYTVGGAYAFAHDSQENATNEANQTVRAKMIEEGLNPDDPNNKAQFEQRVDKIVRVSLAQKGLPGDDEFLFDATTVYRSAQKFLGGWGILPDFIEANASAISGLTADEQKQLKNDLKDPDKYAAIRRQGLMPRAIDLAFKRANISYAVSKSEADREALEILREVKRNTTLLGALLNVEGNILKADVMEIWRRHNKARQDLVQLTFTGNSKGLINVVPASWSGKSEAGAKRASEIFTAEFFGLMGIGKAQPEATAITDSKQTLAAMQAAKEKALTEFSKTGSVEAKEIASYFDSTLDSLEPVTTEKAEKLFQNEYDALKYDPQIKEDRFSRWQLRRAIQRANAKFYSRGFNSAIEENSELRKQWAQLVQQEIVHESGIHPDSETYLLNQEIEAQAQTKLNDRLAGDAKLSAYLGRIAPVERARIEAILKGDYFVESYVEATVAKDDLDPLSPAKPGFFQKLRQTRTFNIRNAHSSVTTAIRMVEALWGNTYYSRGLKNGVFRSVIPVVADVWQGTTRSMRRFPAYLLATYPYNLNIWGNGLKPWSRAAVQFAQGGATIGGPWMTMYRLMANIGLKPGTQASSMIKLAALGSFATCVGPIFISLLDPEITALTHGITAASDAVQNGIAPWVTPVTHAIGSGFHAMGDAAASASHAVVNTVVGFCVNLLKKN